jgi:hypothetical protein
MYILIWALILQWALIYAFMTKKKEEIKIIHSFYMYELKINARKCSQNWPHAECMGAFAWIQTQWFLSLIARVKLTVKLY